VDSAEFVHTVIHIDYWQGYKRLLRPRARCRDCGEPGGRSESLGAWAYRFGGPQVNVHGPWRGSHDAALPPPLNEVGRGDLAFRATRRSDENVAGLLS
jgi:hypothetical protein